MPRRPVSLYDFHASTPTLPESTEGAYQYIRRMITAYTGPETYNRTLMSHLADELYASTSYDKAKAERYVDSFFASASAYQPVKIAELKGLIKTHLSLADFNHRWGMARSFMRSSMDEPSHFNDHPSISRLTSSIERLTDLIENSSTKRIAYPNYM